MERTTGKTQTVKKRDPAIKNDAPSNFTGKPAMASSVSFDDDIRHNRHHHHHDRDSHHHHHHRHGSHHHHHHHHRHSPRHHHHHHHHHHHRHRSCSPSSSSSCDSYDYRSSRGRVHFHEQVRFPRILTARPLKTITPTPKASNTSIYREIGVNTGQQTKLMRDSGTTVDFDEPTGIADKRLEQIPVLRRTIIVEPYPAQPSSQIIVKPRADMVGRVRLTKAADANDANETIVFPTTAFVKKSFKKKKSHVVNGNIIETLNLDSLKMNQHGITSHGSGTPRRKKITYITGKKIKNAFYN